MLCLVGNKQSGKSSAAKYLVGYAMVKAGRLKYFDVDDNGILSANTLYTKPDGTEEEAPGILDIYRKDYPFIRYAVSNIWPHIKVYSFAERLKETLHIVFGVPRENLYGTDEQKNQLSHIKWDNIPSLVKTDKQKGFMTYRELAQTFGTDICRKMLNDCWVQSCYQDIITDGYPIAIIDDGRFDNEIEFAKSVGMYTVKLCKTNNSGDTHSSETSLKNIPDSMFDLIIDNNNMTMSEKNEAVLKFALQVGLFS